MLDCDGSYLGGAETPPNEWPIHACVLRARPDVVSISHTHSVWSTLFSVLPIKLQPLHHYGKFLPAEGPPVYEGVGLVRTVERGDALAAALGNSTAVLMRAHGKPRYLSAEELDTFSSDVLFPARGWEYYVSRLGTRVS